MKISEQLTKEEKMIVEQVSKDGNYPRETINAAEEAYSYILRRKDEAKGSMTSLVALPQSGKTSTVTMMLELLYKSGITQFNVISGPSDKHLNEQTTSRLDKASFPFHAYRASMKKSLKASEDGAELHKKITDKKLLRRLRSPDCFILEENSVVVVDEHHYGSHKSGIMSKMFLAQGFDLSKPMDQWPFPIHIIFVSATPYDLHVEREKEIKKVVLKTSSEYTGFCDHDIKDNFCVKENFSKYIDLIERLLTTKGNKYNIMRLNGSGKNRITENETIESLRSCGLKGYQIPQDVSDFDSEQFEEADFVHLQINQKSSKFQRSFVGASEEPFFDKEPLRPTLVFIHSYFKQGTTFTNKDHIGGILEISSKSREKKKQIGTQQDDNVVQSLAGRLCGYGKPGDVEIYTDIGSIEKHQNWYNGDYKCDDIPNSSKTKTTKKTYLKIIYVFDYRNIENFKVSNAMANVKDELKRRFMKRLLEALGGSECANRFNLCGAVGLYSFDKWNKEKDNIERYRKKLQDIASNDSNEWIGNHFQNKECLIWNDPENKKFYVMFKKDEYSLNKKASKNSMHHFQQEIATQ